jgi:pilus assembly protein TadC
MAKWLIRWILLSLVGVAIFWDYPKPQSDFALKVLWVALVGAILTAERLSERLRKATKKAQDHVD